ncbi:MAG: CBS and ACT domain-containing protein [Candidatus Aminicenantes bacterium]|nr:CBS and ACT domain-containing protein [Candidatus Aminicenantes bacterium]
MKIKEWMVKNPITVTKDQTIQECVDLMKEHSIRHLPVVENKKLSGLVTESNLRQVFLASMIEDLKLEDVMIRDPITVAPDTEIEDAAKLIYHNKIGGLPVVDNDDQVVGIITVADLVAAFIELMGLLKSSSRIDVILGEEPEAFETVSRLIRSRGGEIISVGISGHRLRRERIYFFRLKKRNVQHIVEALEKAGFEVVSSMA